MLCDEVHHAIKLTGGSKALKVKAWMIQKQEMVEGVEGDDAVASVG